MARPLPALPALALLAVGIACSRGSSTLAYEDLLVGGRLVSNLDAQPAGEAFCADELRWSLALRTGEELVAEVEVGEAARLAIAGCAAAAEPTPPAESADSADSADSDIGGRLRIALAGPAGASLSREIVLARQGEEAFAEELDLGRLEGGRVRIALRADLDPGQTLYLRGASLRHRRQVARPAAPRPQPPPRQVLLVSVDTLREDALGALGGAWPTPALDRFAAGAQIFQPHYAAASWTKPSHASLLSGQSPRVHGALAREAPISPAVPMLAERFAAAGFVTAGLVFDCAWLGPRFGFDRGHDEYRAVRWTLPQMTQATVNWIAAHRDQPFFYFLHTFEAHSDFHRLPYEAPGVRQRTVEERFGAADYGRRQGEIASGLLGRMRTGAIPALDGEDAILRFLYGEGVRHVDRELGAFFADLEELGLFDSLLIVLTADHGESLLEHGETLHASPWNQVLRVPLLVKWPGGRAAGTRSPVATSSLDVAPTILAAMGLPRDGLPGADLARPARRRPVHSWGRWRVVVDGRFKAVLRWRRAHELYDLAADPEELHNLAAERPRVLARLRRLAEARWQADTRLAEQLQGAAPRGSAQPLSPEERARLRALGYVGEN
jgi:arylsulfatase A-like enzyme